MDSKIMEAVNMTSLNLGAYFVGLTYFEQESRKIDQPSAEQVVHAVDQLQKELDVTTRTVSIWRMPNADSLVDQFCMQIQGEKDKFTISVIKDDELFAIPDFNLSLGERGEIEVIGNTWPSRLVCTNFEMVKNIATTFVLNGTLAYPEIWEI
jgi:phosphoribosylanthranilate isomerase